MLAAAEKGGLASSPRSGHALGKRGSFHGPKWSRRFRVFSAHFPEAWAKAGSREVAKSEWGLGGVRMARYTAGFPHSGLTPGCRVHGGVPRPFAGLPTGRSIGADRPAFSPIGRCRVAKGGNQVLVSPVSSSWKRTSRLPDVGQVSETGVGRRNGRQVTTPHLRPIWGVACKCFKVKHLQT
jgi:hypothetical protein